MHLILSVKRCAVKTQVGTLEKKCAFWLGSPVSKIRFRMTGLNKETDAGEQIKVRRSNSQERPEVSK